MMQGTPDFVSPEVDNLSVLRPLYQPYILYMKSSSLCADPVDGEFFFRKKPRRGTILPPAQCVPPLPVRFLQGVLPVIQIQGEFSVQPEASGLQSILS